MVRTILIWGLVGGVIVAGLMQLSLLIVNDHMDPMAMWLGYLTMLIAMSTILLGVKQYRDQAGGGVISFWRGLVIGLGIALIAAVIYSAAWELYLAISGKDFIGEYNAAMIAKAQADHVSAAEMARIQAQAAEFQAIYDNPLLRFPMTMVEMLPVGVVVALVSAFALRFPGFLPAKDPIGARA
jgi:hypothetical protein